MTRWQRAGWALAQLVVAVAPVCPPLDRDPFAPTHSAVAQLDDAASAVSSARLAGVVRTPAGRVELVDVGPGPGLVVRHGAATRVRPWGAEHGRRDGPEGGFW